MRPRTHLSAVTALAVAAMVPSSSAAQERTSKYTDAATGITFEGFASGDYRFGVVLPEQQSQSQLPSSDVLVQITSPLQDGGGWGGIALGPGMLGPLLLVAWPRNAATSSVAIGPRVSNGRSAAATVPAPSYGSAGRPLDLRPIARGTAANATHLSATFVCGGCLPDAEGDSTMLGFAYSLLAVARPGDDDTPLADHTGGRGGYGVVRVDLAAARSADYPRYEQMAEPAATTDPAAAPSAGAGSGPETSSSSSSSTSAATTGAKHDGRTSSAAITILALVSVLYAL